MGADLIGYLLKGPEKIELTSGKRDAAESKYAAAELFVEAYEKWEDALSKSFHDECEDLEAKMLNRWERISKFCSQYNEPDLYYGHFTSMQASAGALSTLDGWISWWNAGCPARDSNSRIDPDDPSKMLVFAGELSWGDSPSGYAYEMFEYLDLLDWYGCLGIS